MKSEAELELKLKSIDSKLANINLGGLISNVKINIAEPWELMRVYLGKTTSAGLKNYGRLMGASPEKQETYAKLTPLLVIAKLPVALRLELAEMLEKLVDDITALTASPLTRKNKSKLISANKTPEELLNEFKNNISEFADRNKKITAIGTITTTIAALGGFLVGLILAPFTPLILTGLASHFMKQNSTGKAIGAGILAFVTGILLIPLTPLLGAAFPILKNTALFNYQLDKIKGAINTELFEEAPKHSSRKTRHK